MPTQIIFKTRDSSSSKVLFKNFQKLTLYLSLVCSKLILVVPPGDEGAWPQLIWWPLYWIDLPTSFRKSIAERWWHRASAQTAPASLSVI